MQTSPTPLQSFPSSQDLFPPLLRHTRRPVSPTDNTEFLTRPHRYCDDCLDKEYVANGGPGTEITDAIPSLDMRPVLALFSPEDAFLRIESCAGCGGHLEIVTKETKRVARLTNRIR